MEVISLTKNIIFNHARSFPQPASSSSLSLRYSSRKVSRVCCYTSATKITAGLNAARENRGDVRAWASKEGEYRSVDDVTSKVKETIGEGLEKSKQTAEEIKETTQDFAQDAKDKTVSAAETVGDKAKEGTTRVAETAENVKENIKDVADSVADKAKEGTEKTKEGVLDAADKVKEGTSKAAEATKDAVKGA